MSSQAVAARAIVLAAGRGTRLGGLSAEMPKVMVKLDERTLLAHQRDSLGAAGISDVHMVLGHGADAVEAHPDAQGLRFWRNPAFATTNMVASLLSAVDLLDGTADVIVAYGDIVYEPRLVTALMDATAPIAVVVDLAWKEYWSARMPDPLADAETLRMDETGRIVELGNAPERYEDIQGQYTGLFKISASTARPFAELAHELVGVDPNCYMTSLLQRCIHDGIHVQATTVVNGWLEIDSPSDLNIQHDRFYRGVR